MLRSTPLLAPVLATLLPAGLVPAVASAQPAGGAEQAAARDERAGAGQQALRRVAGILDYIGSDYAVAVDDKGRVVSELEYREQLTLTEDALGLAAQAGLGEDDPVVEGLGELEASLEQKPPPARVLELCKRIKRTLVEQHDVALSPSRPPDAERARALYAAQGCGNCHGDDGGADTERAKGMDPPPADFLDRERVAGVSPHRAFYAISHGVSGTSMTAYDELSEHERWSLAFWVLSLRHEDADLAAGRAHLERAGWPVDPSPDSLAHLRPDDIRAELEGVLGSEAQVEQALAYLRARAPFEDGAPGGFAVARAKLAEGLEAYRAGDGDRALQRFVSAYLDGFEPQEASLSARDPALVREVEDGMLALREKARSGAPAEEVAAEVAALERLLDRAEGEPAIGSTGAFVSSMVIALREGFEAVLLVIALLAFVRTRGTPEHRRWVHAGWLLALPAGYLTWLAVGEALGGLARELAEGIVALVAAVVLLFVTHWFIGEAQMRRGMGFIARKIGQVRGRWAAAVVFGLAFLAVYREAFEVVLFYKALILDAAEHAQMLWLGAGAGLAALAALAAAMQLAGRKLKPRPFMIASSVVLAALSVILVGKGVFALQEAGVLALTRVSIPALPALGVYGSAESLGAQALLALLLLSSVFLPRLGGRRRDARERTGSPAE